LKKNYSVSSSERQQNISNQINNDTGMAIMTNKKASVELYSAIFENQLFLSILNEKI
jgi:hypothetical protein